MFIRTYIYQARTRTSCATVYLSCIQLGMSWDGLNYPFCALPFPAELAKWSSLVIQTDNRFFTILSYSRSGQNYDVYIVCKHAMYTNCPYYALRVASHLTSSEGTSEIPTHIGDNCHQTFRN